MTVRPSLCLDRLKQDGTQLLDLPLLDTTCIAGDQEPKFEQQRRDKGHDFAAQAMHLMQLLSDRPVAMLSYGCSAIRITV